MAEIWKPQDIKVYQDWVETIINEAEEKLNDWERSFISNIQMKLDSGFNLTEKQAVKLESIYADKTS